MAIGICSRKLVTGEDVFQHRKIPSVGSHFTRQVALERTKPHGQVIGIDLLPAQPPKGVTTFQGDFLSPMVQRLVKDLIIERQKSRELPSRSEVEEAQDDTEALEADRPSYIDMERHASQEQNSQTSTLPVESRLVDVC